MIYKHDHWIIEQIIPATIDCYAILAWWDRNDDNPEPVITYRQRVPCFALVAECEVREEDSHLNPTGKCKSNGYQKIVPCIEDGLGYYSPICDALTKSANTEFLGLEYESSSEKEIDWTIAAHEVYAKKKNAAKESHSPGLP